MFLLSSSISLTHTSHAYNPFGLLRTQTKAELEVNTTPLNTPHPLLTCLTEVKGLLNCSLRYSFSVCAGVFVLQAKLYLTD